MHGGLPVPLFGNQMHVWQPILICCYQMFAVQQTRVSDPDPDLHGSALIWAVGSGSAYKLRIRIRIQEGKNDKKNRNKDRIFIFSNAGCSLLRAEGFSCSLGVLYGGLGISKLQFLIPVVLLQEYRYFVMVYCFCYTLSFYFWALFIVSNKYVLSITVYGICSL